MKKDCQKSVSIDNSISIDIKPGDDYAAINQAVYRRYSGLLKSKKAIPDIVFIDGGLGQLNQAIMVMNSIGIESIQLVGVSKGEGRKGRS